MDFYEQYDRHLTGGERSLVEKARQFCAGAFSSDVHAAYRRGEPFPAEWYARWAQEGFLGLQARREDGGFEASFLCKVRVAQEMARHSFAAAFCMNHHQGCVTRLSQTGSARQKEQMLPAMQRGDMLATLALTEPGGGSDAAALTTTAAPVDGGWRLNGAKAWLTNGLIVDALLVLARVPDTAQPDGIAMFLVRLDGPQAGQTVTRREIVVPGARSFRLAEIGFRDHFVPAWALFAPPGEAFKSAMTGINAARVHVAAMCVATLEAALAEAVAYCKGRHAFGKPLLAHQGLRWELAEVAARLEAASALVFRAAQHIDRREPILTLAAQCKKFAVDTALWGVDQCIRAMGAVGAADSQRLGMLHAEVRMAAYADGTGEMLLDRIGRGLTDDYPVPQG